MKIGVDACTWNNRRGFGRFTRELLEAVLADDKKNEYLFFVDSQFIESDEFPSNVKTIIAQTQVSPMQAASASGRRSVKDLWSMSREVLHHKIDLFFFPAVYSYFPILNRTKIIVTIHDVIADHHPELVFPNSKLKMFWKLKQNMAIRQANLILTVSDYSKREIIEYFKLPESKVRVVSEAAHSVFSVLQPSSEMNQTLSRFGLETDEDFLLYVGGISPHKNLNALIAAFQIIISDADFSSVKLVLVGDYRDDPFFSAYPSLKKQIDRLGLSDKVIFTGYIEDLELAHLYNSTTLVVLPSLEEGFGLPAVEAMACGAPVAASNRGSLPEVLGKAGRFFDPTDTENMAETLRHILGNHALRKEMSQTGLVIAKEFLWNKAAKDMLVIFNELENN
ncbi:MAG: glycosyltransferase family 4 protein [Acidobacteriota bacterium]|nr:glycosyltransferase family 4 protein [Acidobacteriota bacterium]